MIEQAALCRHRGAENNRAATGRHHAPRGFPQEQEGAGQVRVQGRPPFLVGGEVSGFQEDRADAIHDADEAVNSRQSGVKRASHRLGLGGVHSKGVSSQLAGALLQARLAACRQCDFRALGAQSPGDLRSDTAGAAGNEIQTVRRVVHD
jgi:hypothetical protein